MAVAATLLLSIAAGTATALRSIETGGGNLTREYREMRFFNAIREIKADVTLRGSLVARIPKIAGAEIGRITAANTANCTAIPGGACTLIINVEANTPIRKRLVGFVGTLPNIAGILSIYAAPTGQIRLGGRESRESCFFEGEWTDEAGRGLESDRITRSNERITRSEGTICGEELTVEGSDRSERHTLTLL